VFLFFHIGNPSHNGPRSTLLIPFVLNVPRTTCFGAVNATKPRLVRRTVVIPEQEEKGKFGLDSCLVSMSNWLGADGRLGHFAFVNPTQSSGCD
jgi:hypothetical protein